MIRIVGALYLILAFMTTSNAVAAKQCVKIFPTFKMTAKIQKSINNTISSLAELRLRIDQSQAQGTISIDHSVLATNYVEKEKTLARYLVQNEIMTAVELKEKIKEEISILQSRKKITRSVKDDTEKIKNQNKTIKSSLNHNSKVIFHRIQPGSFIMGTSIGTKSVTLTKPYEMMATPTTQRTWFTVAHLFNTKIRDRSSDQDELNTDPSTFKGATHPVETVEYPEVQVWIDALNTLSKNGEPTLFELIPDHKTGDTYRLPTEAEWEFVVRDRGYYNDKYPFGNDSKKLKDYAWFVDNSRNHTHPVAKKTPIIVDGNAFYDLLGNVHEMTLDNFDYPLPGGVDPLVISKPKSPDKSVRGGSWESSFFFTDSTGRELWHERTANCTIGFRLVREVRP